MSYGWKFGILKLRRYSLKDFISSVSSNQEIYTQEIAKGSKVDNTDNITFSKFSQKPIFVVTNENDQITKQHIQNYTDVARENTEEKSGQPHHKFSKNLAYTVSSLSTSLDSYSTKPAFNQSLKQSDEPSQSAQTSCEQEEICVHEIDLIHQHRQPQ